MKAGLFKVAIVGQRLGDTALLHHDEAGTVSRAPALVRASGVAFEGGLKLGVGLRDDLNPRTLHQPLNQSRSGQSGALSAPAWEASVSTNAIWVVTISESLSRADIARARECS